MITEEDIDRIIKQLTKIGEDAPNYDVYSYKRKDLLTRELLGKKVEVVKNNNEGMKLLGEKMIMDTYYPHDGFKILSKREGLGDHNIQCGIKKDEGKETIYEMYVDGKVVWCSDNSFSSEVEKPKITREELLEISDQIIGGIDRCRSNKKDMYDMIETAFEDHGLLSD